MTFPTKPTLESTNLIPGIEIVLNDWAIVVLGVVLGT